MLRLTFVIIITIISFQLLNAKNYRIAVSELDAKGVSATDANIITDFLRNDLFVTGRFEVLERAKMNEILEEIAFQQSGCTTAECAVEMGKILNVEKMIVGSVSRLGDTYYVNIRFVDVATGKIDFADRVSCKCPIDILPTSITDLANRIAKAVYEKTPGKTQPRELGVSEGTGVLYVKTDPQGTEVFIDGNLKGTSPYVDTNIPSGNHFIKIKWKDNREKEEFITIEPNEVKRLEYRPDESVNYNANKLIILSKPVEAKVYLDGLDIGKTPLIKENLTPGKHQLFFMKNKKWDFVVFEIEKGQTQTIRSFVTNDLDNDNLFKMKMRAPSISKGGKIFLNGVLVKNPKNPNDFSIGSVISENNSLQPFLTSPINFISLVVDNRIAFINLKKLLSIWKIKPDTTILLNPKEISISIIPSSEDYIVYFNNLMLGRGTIEVNVNDLIRRNKLFLSDKNIILLRKDREYICKSLSLNFNKGGTYIANFKGLQISTVKFNIKPRPFLLLINSDARLYDVSKLDIEPGRYNFTIIPVPSFKNKKYETEVIFKAGDTFNLEYDFREE